MSEGHVTAGHVVAGHIEVGPVVVGHIEEGLYLLVQMYHTWPSSVQNIQGPLVNPHDNIPGHAALLCAALSMELKKAGQRKCCSCSVDPPCCSWKIAGRWHAQELLLLVLIRTQQGLSISSGVIAGFYLATECLDSLGLSQLLIHHACQLLSTSFFRHSGCCRNYSCFIELLSKCDEGHGHLIGM